MLVRIRDYTLDDIQDGIKLLLERGAHSPEVRQHAINITYDKQDKISTIYDWIKHNVSYVPDPIGAGGEEIELFTSPVKMIRDYNLGLRPAEDCDGQAILATSLYRAIGTRANVVIIDSVGNGLDHAYSRVWSDGLNDWVNCDPSSQYPLGWSFSYRNRIIVE